MELQPAHIRNRSFKKQTFGGYKPSEVHDFLLQVSEAYAHLKLEHQSLSERLYETQESLNRVREIEKALLHGLQRSENQHEEIISQSKKEAEVRVMEGKIAAEALVNTAKQKAQQMLHNVKHECEQKMERMRIDFDILDQSYAEVESHVGKLIAQMQSFVEDTNKQIAHLSSLKGQKAVERKLSSAKQLLGKTEQQPPNANTPKAQTPSNKTVSKPTDSENIKGNSPKDTHTPQPRPRTLHESLQQQSKGPENMQEFFKGIDNS